MTLFDHHEQEQREASDPPEAMCHAALVTAAAKWLQKKRCTNVLTEIATAAFEQPDAIGWYGTQSTLVECKASRSDFLADRLKPFRVNPNAGMGRLRYFLSTPGIIKPDELPPRWGLLELTGQKVREAVKAQPFEAISERHEIAVLLSCLRRIGQTAPAGVSIKCYTIETQGRATLGVDVNL